MARTGHLRLHLSASRLRIPVLVLAVAIPAACARASGPVILATTSSVGNSGLLDAVLPEYRDDIVRPVLVGSGRALDMLAAGSADVVISHAPAREAAALAAHPSWTYRKILYNDFLIVGPLEDPAGVAHAADAVSAMIRIARSGARFLSRGDESGTHEREQELWQVAGLIPEAARLVIAGAGMGQTLRIADSTGAYTLTDRGTFEALRQSVRLTVAHEGDSRLLNTYAVLADPRNDRGATFVRWLTKGAGKDVIGAVLREQRIRGFTPWPAGLPGSTPSDLPR